MKITPEKTILSGDGVELLKESFELASEKSKRAIKEILDTCNAQAKTNAANSQKTIDSAIKQLEEYNVNASYFRLLYSTFGKSVELSNDEIDSLMELHNTRVTRAVEFNKKVLNSLKEQSELGNKFTEKQIKILQDNFTSSVQFSVNGMKEFINMYNHNLNLLANFNSSFFYSVNSQMTTITDTYKKQSGLMNKWVSGWWDLNSERKN